jgi:CRP-like cAMP-binding protein
MRVRAAQRLPLDALLDNTSTEPATPMDQPVTRAAIFRPLGPNVVAAVSQWLLPADYRPGQLIFAEGEPGDRLYIIASGKVKVACRAPGGREMVQAVLGPSDMCGELAVFDSGPRSSTATAVTEVRAMFAERAALGACITDHPEIAEQLLRVLARRLRRTIDNQVELMATDVRGRLARLLLQLGQQFGSQNDGAIYVSHDLTQKELAQLIGASRETVNQALTDFARRGWIQLSDKSVLILDSEHLMQRTR